MKTVLITGCSSGYGLETARYFHSQGWSVIATMRQPREEILPRSPRMRVLPLDVTHFPPSIDAALEASGAIDVLVNNAGIGVVGAFEATPMAHVRKVFETKLVRRDGDDAGGDPAVPPAAGRGGGERDVERDAGGDAAGSGLYGEQGGDRRFHTGSLAHELAAFHVRVKLVEPGYAPTTRFAHNTDVRIEDLIPETYAEFARPIFAAFAAAHAGHDESGMWPKRCGGRPPDKSGQLRFPAGADAVALARAS